MNPRQPQFNERTIATPLWTDTRDGAQMMRIARKIAATHRRERIRAWMPLILSVALGVGVALAFWIGEMIAR